MGVLERFPLFLFPQQESVHICKLRMYIGNPQTQKDRIKHQHDKQSSNNSNTNTQDISHVGIELAQRLSDEGVRLVQNFSVSELSRCPHAQRPGVEVLCRHPVLVQRRGHQSHRHAFAVRYEPIATPVEKHFDKKISTRPTSRGGGEIRLKENVNK